MVGLPVTSGLTSEGEPQPITIYGLAGHWLLAGPVYILFGFGRKVIVCVQESFFPPLSTTTNFLLIFPIRQPVKLLVTVSTGVGYGAQLSYTVGLPKSFARLLLSYAKSQVTVMSSGQVMDGPILS